MSGDRALPDDFDLSEHYGDDGLHDPFHDDQEDCNDDEQQEPASHGKKRPARKPAPKRSDSAHGTPSMLKALFEFFIPPINQDPETQRRWKISLGFAVLCLSTATLIAWGIFRPFGFQGFAHASDVKSIKTELLEQRIFDARLLQCNASTAESRRFYASKVQDLLRRYVEIEGQYRLPLCQEVQ